MKYLYPIAAIPNELICDPVIHYTTKRVAAVLLFMAGRKNRTVCVTFAELARLARCSAATAQQAVAELIAGGYILKSRRYRFGEAQNHLIYNTNAYQWIRRQGGYTLIRREILDYSVMTAAAFTVLLFVYRCAGRKGRAFPSLRRIAGALKDSTKYGLSMAKSTVCQALAVLRRLQAIICLKCMKGNGCFACNSYLVTDVVMLRGDTQKETAFSSVRAGSTIFSKPRYINIDNKGYYLEGKKDGGAFDRNSSAREKSQSGWGECDSFKNIFNHVQQN